MQLITFNPQWYETHWLSEAGITRQLILQSVALGDRQLRDRILLVACPSTNAKFKQTTQDWWTRHPGFLDLGCRWFSSDREYEISVTSSSL